VKQVVNDLPRFAAILDSEQITFKTHWDSIWNSFFESVQKKLRLACGTGGKDQDISDSIAFLRAARKLLQQQRAQPEPASAAAVLAPPPPTTAARDGAGASPAPSDAVRPSVPGDERGGGTSSTSRGTPTSTTSPSRNDSARESGKGGWGSVGSRLLSLVSGAGQEKHDTEEVDFEDAAEDFEVAAEQEGAAAVQAESMGVNAEFHVNAEAPAPAASLPLCVFPLPIEARQLQTLIEKLDGLLGQIEVDTEVIDAEWVLLVEKIDFRAEMTSFEETLRFVRKVKLQGQAIVACGEYGYLKQTPTADRAVTRISTSASDCIKSLDSSKPEEAVRILHNLKQIRAACPRIIDDDMELQGALTAKLTSHCQEADAWVAKMQRDLAEKGVQFYAKAEKERDPVERKKMLHEVTKSLDLHVRIQEKLVACQLREDNAAEPPLLVQIKERIRVIETDLRQRLRRGENVTADEIAMALHTIYVTAFDLDQISILKHAEACIGGILHDCKGRPGLQLQQIGTVLECHLPQGSEIVANIPQFAELNLLQFQAMTQGKSVEGTVEEVAKLNKLTEENAETLLRLIKEINLAYQKFMRDFRFNRNLPMIARNIKSHYDGDKSIPGLIGGVFAIWSMSSITEQCPTPRMPLPAQLVAVVRLLALDKPVSTTFWVRVGSGLGLASKLEPPIHASNRHLAQIKTGQGKSVVLGTLATVLCVAGFQ